MSIIGIIDRIMTRLEFTHFRSVSRSVKWLLVFFVVLYIEQSGIAADDKGKYSVVPQVAEILYHGRSRLVSAIWYIP